MGGGRGGNNSKDSYLVFSPATFAIVMQIVLMYVVSVLFKSGNVWRIEGSATYYALKVCVLLKKDEPLITSTLKYLKPSSHLLHSFISWISLGHKQGISSSGFPLLS